MGKYTAASLLFCACMVLAAGICRADWIFSPSSIDTDKIQSGGPPKDGIPAIMEPRFLAAADADFLSGDDMVIGLVIDGEARAYPLRILSWHELVNDVAGGTPVLVSW